MSNHAVSYLGGVGAVKVIVVDVEYRIGVRGSCGFERNSDKILSQYRRKDRITQRPIFIEDLINNVL
jgi:hypothetical protein